ncbi:MAG TPA: sulfatase-like hydrolase/transferase [Candidatus Binatus sp.]|nr:sulfatase-like hydrolase/transferase [Candidatus Binatus sp.]
MRRWINPLLKVVAGTYFVLTSLYCLLAFLPYTFVAFIKTPPYAWMPWLAHHQAALYWAAIAAALAAGWPSQDRAKSKRFLVGIGLLGSAGVYVTLRPFLPGLENNGAAYAWSLIALLPLVAISVWQTTNAVERGEPGARAEGNGAPFGFSAGLLVALVVSAIYTVGARVRLYSDTHALGFHGQDVAVAFWSLVSHFALAIVVLSALNFIFLIAARTSRPRMVRRGLVGALIAVVLSVVLTRFLGNAMSFDGWSAYFYASAFALTLTLWGFAIVEPFLARTTVTEIPKTTVASSVARDEAKISSGQTSGQTSAQTVATWVTIVVVTGLALGSRWLIGGEDWNGFVESTAALLFWIVMSLCVYRLRPVRANYSAVVIFGVLLAAIFVYKGLQATEIFWGKSVGSTDDEISLKLEEYGTGDASFLLAHHMLGNGRGEVCGDLCRIMREYTNIRDTRTQAEVRLVDHLSLTQSGRPNVFVFVIDAMRPDYLGAYNPRVDYTPNLDAFARDSVVLHHAYSQYAGTSLSEPALWAGAMMLHAHYLQPFSRVNGLEQMLRADNYHMIVSMDEVVKEILLPTDDLVKLDMDKKLWNHLEIGSTLQQAQSVLDGRTESQGPIFFYDQPKNVHQFARNDVPSPTSQHWPDRPGLNTRITYEVHWVDKCLGEFFAYLKQHGMYDDSIIIVTSDHGDATGEFGRTSHSTSIWPEIMKVPLIIHLPQKMREHLVYDDSRVSTLTDITPTLYYLLGHRPIRQNPLFGRPLFAETKEELDRYPKKDLLLASDVRAVYGILTADGRYLYTTYDSPAQSYLFDLTTDPNAEHSILTPPLKQRYDEEIIEHLHSIADFYGYKPGVESLLAATTH